MAEPESSMAGPFKWLRPYSLVWAVLSAGLLGLHAWQWARGRGRWYDALPALAFLTLALTNVFEGRKKHVLQATSIVVLIAAIAALITRL